MMMIGCSVHSRHISHVPPMCRGRANGRCFQTANFSVKCYSQVSKGHLGNLESMGALILEVGKGSGNFLEDMIPEIVFSRLWEFAGEKLTLIYLLLEFQGCTDLTKIQKRREEEGGEEERNTLCKGQIDVSLVRTSLPGTKS